MQVLERELENLRGGRGVQEVWKDYDKFARKEKEHEVEVEKRVKDLNTLGHKVEELELENRFLREMTGMPENFG